MVADAAALQVAHPDHVGVLASHPSIVSTIAESGLNHITDYRPLQKCHERDCAMSARKWLDSVR